MYSFLSAGFEQRGSDLVFVGRKAINGVNSLLKRVRQAFKPPIPLEYFAAAAVVAAALAALLAGSAVWARRQRLNSRGAGKDGGDIEAPPAPPLLPPPVRSGETYAIFGSGDNAPGSLNSRCASYEATATPFVSVTSICTYDSGSVFSISREMSEVSVTISCDYEASVDVECLDMPSRRGEASRKRRLLCRQLQLRKKGRYI